MIFWVFAAAWIVLVGMLGLFVLPLIVRQARRIVARVFAYSDQSPLPLQFAKAEADVERTQRALNQVNRLTVRAAAALAVVRKTPMLPPALVALATRLAVEVRAFQAALR